jgi:hypothetical protein
MIFINKTNPTIFQWRPRLVIEEIPIKIYEKLIQ